MKFLILVTLPDMPEGYCDWLHVNVNAHLQYIAPHLLHYILKRILLAHNMYTCVSKDCTVFGVSVPLQLSPPFLGHIHVINFKVCVMVVVTSTY